jgi:hypothetical protein
MRLEEILARVREGTATAEDLRAALPLLQAAGERLSDWLSDTRAKAWEAANTMAVAVASQVETYSDGRKVLWDVSLAQDSDPSCVTRRLLQTRLTDAVMAFLTGEETAHVARQEAPPAATATRPVYVHQEIAIDVTSHAWGLIKRVSAKDCDHGVGHDCREAAPGMPGNWCDPCLARILLEARG